MMEDTDTDSDRQSCRRHAARRAVAASRRRCVVRRRAQRLVHAAEDAWTSISGRVQSPAEQWPIEPLVRQPSVVLTTDGCQNTLLIQDGRKAAGCVRVGGLSGGHRASADLQGGVARDRVSQPHPGSGTMCVTAAFRRPCASATTAYAGEPAISPDGSRPCPSSANASCLTHPLGCANDRSLLPTFAARRCGELVDIAGRPASCALAHRLPRA